ncbi:MAG TPA: 6-bladed beta-propeller [Clostridiales bacterium]|nr:6-bladed beta-propeller [Clostridiales bacterium]
MKKLLILLSVLCLLISCSKNTSSENAPKVFNNSTKPADPDFTIEIIEQKTLQNDSTFTLLDMPWDAAEDNEGNIYILSGIKCKILKYDKDLNFITDIANAGPGPGELTNPNNIFIVKDTLFVTDSANKSLNRFTLNGDFLFSTLEPAVSQSHTFVEKNGLYASQSIELFETDEVMTGRSKLSLLDSKFKTITDICDGGETEDFIFFKSRIPYAVSDKNIYVAENITDRYRISVYDRTGKLTEVINKNYAMVPFEYKKDRWSKFFGTKYKRSISNLYIDYAGNLWVMRAFDDAPDKDNYNDPFRFDVFKDGRFINEVTLDGIEYESFDYGTRTKVLNDRIYSFYIGEDKVVVSKYKIMDR